MAEISLETKEFAFTDCIVMSSGLEDAIKKELGLPSNYEIAFALIVADHKVRDNPQATLKLMHSPQRTALDVSWDVMPRTRRHYPGANDADPRAVNPQDGEVLVITYPGKEYVGFCTKIGGVPVWF